jgi:hypothetical protein
MKYEQQRPGGSEKEIHKTTRHLELTQDQTKHTEYSLGCPCRRFWERESGEQMSELSSVSAIWTLNYDIFVRSAGLQGGVASTGT